MLLGDPVEGSLSPAMHNAAFRELGMAAVYVAVGVPRDFLGDIVNGIRSLGVKGFNVTIPYKITVIDLLDELDDSASSVEAVNTVVNSQGRLIGYNTDGEGALRALEERLGLIRGKRVLLLGAGGAARAIAYALVKEGCGVTVANRTLSKAEALASIVKRRLNRELSVIPLERSELEKALRETEILVNATSVGMYPNMKETLVTADMLHPGLVVMDIVYKPPMTMLLQEAEKAGATVINGLGMLVHQAGLSFRIWTGREPPIGVMRIAAERSLWGS
jgi:shikimate dehydrogenase